MEDNDKVIPFKKYPRPIEFNKSMKEIIEEKRRERKLRRQKLREEVDKILKGIDRKNN